MSNIFKSNSRFSVLIDDIPEKKNNSKKDKEEKTSYETPKNDHFNYFTSERPIKTESRFRSFNEKEKERYRLEREEEIKLQKELEEREKERINKELLKIENFPDLVAMPKKKNKENNTKISYIEKLKTEDKITNVDCDLDDLKPGWVLLKRDPLTGETIIKNHPETCIKEKEEKTDQEIMMDILNALADLYEKRTQEYIENYGYDEWERMFKFPDWREREAYLEEMEEMENQTDESEYEDEDEEYE